LLASLLLIAAATPAPSAPDTDLWRLDCGTIEIGNLDDYSDNFAYVGRIATFTDSFYSVRDGDRYLLWDTGLPTDALGQGKKDGTDHMQLRSTLPSQLARIGGRPEKVTFVGISHYHYDHTGQAAAFPGATLLFDKADWERVKAREDLASNFAPWIGGKSKVDALTYDKDVFGDEAIVMLRTPGHTPGHRSLLVRLQAGGAILLTGDVAHFRENWTREGVPSFNTSRAESTASLHRLKEIADQTGATVIIQHDPGDVGKLPASPASAK
jgi:glyoxylase-like metal-dependent hydrolase (beta-lactamase superfamily II)